VNSEAKTFTALLFGIIAARTDVDENTLVRDWLTPGEMNVDPIATALTLPPLNPNSRVFNLLTQTGQDPDQQYGYRPPWFYNAEGGLGMNALVKLMDKVVQANPDAFPGSSSANDVAENELFKPLGMTATHWDGVVASHTLYSNVLDMAKLGELLLRKGRWGNRQIVDPDYIYRMSHPQVEDINTSYGYLTWLNAAANAAVLFQEKNDQTCEPYAGWKRYPHAPTYDSTSDNGGAPFRSGIDDGIFWGDGAGGNFTEVHRGLDMVLVVRDDETAPKSDPQSQAIGKANPTGLEYHRMWRILRPALIAADPKYKGDEAGFCNAYRKGLYAPDLISGWSASSGFGSVHLPDH
jgi:CubicO group peptidase (beta-lactamase class C family)